MPDWKPEGRVKDPEALKRFRLAHVGEPCDLCELRPGTEAHHVQFRSQSGDDVESNLLWLCAVCHGSRHGVRVILHDSG